MRAIGVSNGNWKGGRRTDTEYTRPLSPDELRRVKIDTLLTGMEIQAAQIRRCIEAGRPDVADQYRALVVKLQNGLAEMFADPRTLAQVDADLMDAEVAETIESVSP